MSPCRSTQETQVKGENEMNKPIKRSYKKKPLQMGGKQEPHQVKSHEPFLDAISQSPVTKSSVYQSH